MQKALGHAKIKTTGRYLHARPANELAEAFSRAQAATGVLSDQVSAEL